MSREMVDSGIPWIGEIPKGWVVRKLRNVGCFSASGIDKKIVEGEPLVHIINYVDVYKNTNKELRTHEYMLVSAPIEKCSEHQVNVGDMIFTPSSETIEDIGISAVVMDELPNTAFSYHVLRFQPTDVVYLRYRKYFTNNNYCLSYFSSCATGTIRKTISRDVFKECLIVLPPFSEQQKIAEFLDSKCAEVDEMIALQEQIIEELKAYKQSVITEAVTKGLNPNVPMKDSGIEWIGEIPEHWEVKRLKYVSNISRGLFNHRPRNDERYYGGIHPFIQTGDVARSNKYIKSYSQTLSDLGISVSKFFPKGTLTMTIAANVGDVSILGFNAYFPDSVLGIIPASGVDNIFLYYTLKAMKGEFVNAAIVSTQLNLNIERVYNMKAVIPPFSEQQKIASYLDVKCPEIDSLIALKQAKIEELKEYKKSIIYEYVTGKKEVV